MYVGRATTFAKATSADWEHSESHVRMVEEHFRLRLDLYTTDKGRERERRHGGKPRLSKDAVSSRHYQPNWRPCLSVFKKI